MGVRTRDQPGHRGRRAGPRRDGAEVGHCRRHPLLGVERRQADRARRAPPTAPCTDPGPGTRPALRIAAGILAATPAITSFLHVDDDAAAAVLALGWPSCIANIVDDDPAPGAAWVPAITRARPPAPAVESLSAPWERGASISCARTTLVWKLRFPPGPAASPMRSSTGTTQRQDARQTNPSHVAGDSRSHVTRAHDRRPAPPPPPRCPR